MVNDQEAFNSYIEEHLPIWNRVLQLDEVNLRYLQAVVRVSWLSGQNALLRRAIVNDEEFPFAKRS